MSSPNFLFFFSDQHRGDILGALGFPAARTPVLDALAARGILMTRAFCNSPLCMPSRASMVHGLYPRETGILENSRRPIPAADTTFVHALGRAGYHTMAIGKTHYHWPQPETHFTEEAGILVELGFSAHHETSGKMMAAHQACPYTDHLKARGLYEGFQRDYDFRAKAPVHHAAPSVLPFEDYHDSYIGRRAVEWIEDAKQHEPFFCQVGFVGPHDPWDAPEPYASLVRPEEVVLPPAWDHAADTPVARRILGYQRSGGLTEEALRKVVAQYLGMIALNDHWVGKGIEALERAGLASNTVVVYASDHGELLGDHGLFQKSAFYEPAVRVPLIAAGPGVAAGRRSEALADLLDVSATFVDLAGAARPEAHRGRSLRALWEGRTPSHREVLRSEVYDWQMARTGALKAVRAVETGEVQEVYDLPCDPEERTNLAHDPAWSARARDLFARPPFSEPAWK